MTPVPAVIDTNVVVSGVLTRHAVSPTARILDAMLGGKFRFLLSIELLAEYREVLLRPKIRRRHRLSDADVEAILTEIAANGIALELKRVGLPARGRPQGPPLRPMALPAKKRRKRGDEHLWELLAASASAFLLTGDQKLIDEPVAGARVMTPRAFVELLGE